MKVIDSSKLGGRLRRGVIAALVVSAAGAGLAAQAQPGPGPEGRDGGGWHHHGGDERGGMMEGRGLQRMLDEVDATTAQRGQIKDILRAARADVRTQMQAERALHEKGMQLFTQPTVDAAAAENLRQQTMALRDQSSKRMLQALLDASKVLTPEQRAKLGERMKRRHEMMEKRMREHGPASAPAK